MLIETDWLNIFWIRVRTKVTPFKLTKYDFAFVDTLVSFSLKGIVSSMIGKPRLGQSFLIVEASRSHSLTALGRTPLDE
jgi:hypothetical protein